MRVRSKCLVLLGPALLALSGCGTQTHETVSKAPPAPMAKPSPTHTGPALWKVADADTTIYLFGTIHALPYNIEWYRGPVATALGKSDTLVTEIAPGAMSKPAAQEKTMAMAMLPPGENLRDLLDPQQRARYEAQMTKLGLPVEAFDRFDPWFASITLSILPLIKSGYSPDSGVEKVIDVNAGPDKKRDQLETVEFQLGLFDKMTRKQQIDFLMATVDSADTLVDEMNRMVTDWAEGDAVGLAELMNEQLTDANLADVLLYSRNRNWAQWIDDRLDKPGTVFIAVGAGHLAGANSVQDYLAQRHITTTRIQ